jgi:hypothetical protein
VARGINSAQKNPLERDEKDITILNTYSDFILKWREILKNHNLRYPENNECYHIWDSENYIPRRDSSKIVGNTYYELFCDQLIILSQRQDDFRAEVAELAKSYISAVRDIIKSNQQI